MDVQITGRNIEITDAIRDYVLKRMDRLDKYLSVVVDAHVTLYVEKIFHSVVITVRKRRLTLHAEERSEDLYSSIDKAVDKLVTQLRRHKDRIKSHNSRHRQGPDYGDGPDLNLQVDVLDGLAIGAAGGATAGSQAGDGEPGVVVESADELLAHHAGGSQDTDAQLVHV